MTSNKIDGKIFAQMVAFGASHLTNNVKIIDALNVFPVPDGDTGTNMNLTMTSGAKEVRSKAAEHVGKATAVFAKGLLMGARGNSGVILSQLFRGFSKDTEQKQFLNAQEFAHAFEAGVESAYKAVMKPVEGTILTVAKDAAKAAVQAAKHKDDVIYVMEEILREAKASLKRTPDLLPVLKEVGVVDSGGQGLVTIYEGFAAALKGEELPEGLGAQPSMQELVSAAHHKSAQGHYSTDDIEFGYCTEFMVKFEKGKQTEDSFSEEKFRQELSQFGDSLLVVADEEIVKVHIHAEYPGEVMTYGQKYGSLINMKIENMREQHTHILEESMKSEAPVKKAKDKYAIVTVSMGDGIAELFKSLGAKVVIEGGQTMNPSTEDIVAAIERANAEKVIILPNNSNIVMAAEQAAQVVDIDAAIVPSKTVPQGMAALLAFNPSTGLEDNVNTMRDVLSHVKSGQITYAVRDTSIDGLTIKQDDFIGIKDGKIVATSSERLTTAKNLLNKMIDEDTDEIVTILIGQDVSDEESNQLVGYLEEHYPDLEIETHRGNQPLYAFIISVE